MKNNENTETDSEAKADSSPSICSAAAKRIETNKIIHTYMMLTTNPEARAETIARHYASLATTALQLIEAIEIRRDSGFTTDAMENLIDTLTYRITQEHVKAFGIKLEWSTAKFD